MNAWNFDVALEPRIKVLSVLSKAVSSFFGIRVFYTEVGTKKSCTYNARRILRPRIMDPLEAFDILSR